MGVKERLKKHLRALGCPERSVDVDIDRENSEAHNEALYIKHDHAVEKALRKVPQFTRLKRHVIALCSHSTPAKLANLLRVEFERKARRVSVSGYPYILIIDPGNICNLRCPLCPSGLDIMKRKRQFVRFPDFRQIVDRLERYLYEVILHNWGEPLLNPDIYDMIQHCSDKNIGTSLSTNFSLEHVDIDKLVSSGLEYLVVSLDGTTQDVYSEYRIGGNIDLVLANIARIVDKKRETGRKRPFIEWQFIVMKHNCHQIDSARKMAKELGVDLIRFIPAGLPFNAPNREELAQKWCVDLTAGRKNANHRSPDGPIKMGCFYLYRSVTVNPVGAVGPCCVVFDEDDDFGNMLETDFSEIWNNDKYRSARALFAGTPSTVRTVCESCDMFQKA